MEQHTGLRARKKNATWDLLKTTALAMFEERGYENVSVAEIAAAAEVSKATVFNYFPSKEDLVIGGMKQHTGDAARIVRERPVGQTPHDALREHFLHLLERHAPQVGMSDSPLFLQIQRLLIATPVLMISAMDYRRRSSIELSEELMAEGYSQLTSRLVGAQLLHTQYILVELNVRRMLNGDPIEDIRRQAFAAAHHAFGLLENGIGDLMRRDTEPPAPDASYTPDGCRVDYEPGGSEAREAAERVLNDTENELLQDLTDPRR
ncbi:TetR/AcrR family transcriptional regulator [Glycomyces harbinensis]|uniref:Transcriptional regulator, TetR family n=1 Tax=Glycomyces harbinensis TaxID=58114 RepID=A0A1G6XA54_9ACTN|nr:TetR/AcrR family transcriptional regulator [Glycomyces harbinensis]SDD74227.1 transcriptional regulator, TetR family [Glycomyces harbinensis]